MIMSGYKTYKRVFVIALFAVVAGLFVPAQAQNNSNVNVSQIPVAREQLPLDETLPIPRVPGEGGVDSVLAATQELATYQQNVGGISGVDRDIRTALEGKTRLKDNGVNPDAEMKTVLFTLWQHKLLQEAKREFVTRPPTQSQVNNASGANASEPPPANGPRVLSLGGISYASGEKWTIWLNGQRITPLAIPEEVLDISVNKQYIELKWFDDHTNLIFPIRLRPNQRFNLEQRIFLPGTAR